MSRQPTAPPDTPTIEVRTPATAPDLTVNKVIAGAGAAATAAVLGSYLGAAGTVTGAALGSVASTVATTLYQRSLDRTRDTVVARIRPGLIPEQRRRSATGGPDADTVVFEPVPPPRRPWRRAVVGAVIVFVLGLAAVTGLEWVKGSTLLTNESGTSVGRVVVPTTDTGTSSDGSTGTTDDDSADTGSDGQDTGTDGQDTGSAGQDTGAGDPTSTPDGSEDVDATTSPTTDSTPTPESTGLVPSVEQE